MDKKSRIAVKHVNLVDRVLPIEESKRMAFAMGFDLRIVLGVPFVVRKVA